MVAAAKLRRAQNAVESARPYSERMEKVLANLASGLASSEGAPRLLAGTGSDKVQLLIVCTAERGLCGGFNSSIVRLVREKANALINQGKTIKIICVGKKGHDALKRQFERQIIDVVDFRSIKALSFQEAESVASRVFNLFEDGEFDEATLFYSKFKSVISQIPTAQRIIPADISASSSGGSDAVYDYEPDEAGILETLLPRNITVQIFRALLENAASEQGSRMSAMDSATRNAGEMIKKQTMKYNRSRQAMITKELIEIISGAVAL
jgi:F-type H+-transporting ATPase subunit gamma